MLATVPQDRRHSLVAECSGDGDGICYRFDSRVQSAGETVFFDI